LGAPGVRNKIYQLYYGLNHLILKNLTRFERCGNPNHSKFLLVPKRNFKIGTVMSIPKYKKWKGYISSDRISGTVMVQRKTWKSFWSKRKRGTVLLVPMEKVEQLYLIIDSLISGKYTVISLKIFRQCQFKVSVNSKINYFET